MSFVEKEGGTDDKCIYTPFRNSVVYCEQQQETKEGGGERERTGSIQRDEKTVMPSQ